MGDEKDGWRIEGAVREISRRRLERVMAAALPGRAIASIEPVRGGLSNANYRVTLDGGTSVLIRGCVRSPAAAAKEADLYARLRGVVPVPEVLHQEPGEGAEPPCLVLRWIDGIPLRDLRATRDLPAIAQAARSVGRTLAAIGRVTFERGGFLGPGLAIEPMNASGAATAVGFIEACAASEGFRSHAGERLVEELRGFLGGWRGRAARLDGHRSLVHSDFNSRNILVDRTADGWVVAGVIDWEFAFAGSPLFDVGNLLRYERSSRPLLEPHFSEGYREAGGALPEGWQALARVGDLAALCELLTRPGLDPSIVDEVRGLVRATIAGEV